MNKDCACFTFIIGIVDKLLKGMEDNVFPTKEEGRLYMDKFLKDVGLFSTIFQKLILFFYNIQHCILRKSYQGCHSLEVLI